MSDFQRNFRVETAEGELAANPWFGDLLRLWCPAGDPGDGKQVHLRLAVRREYLNFYRNGQSVAKVSVPHGKLKAAIHNKYVNRGTGDSQKYATLTADGLRLPGSRTPHPYGGAGNLREWVTQADGYSDDEKKFVDKVVGRNPDVIDLEIALPGVEIKGKKVAPRIDLAMLEPVAAGWRIVFWEAKRVTDGRARRRIGDPEVVEQIETYEGWLRSQEAQVVAAFQEACRVLAGFHAIAKGFNPKIADLGPGIIAAAKPGAPPLKVDTKVRLVIDSGRDDHHFETNGHLEKLRAKGVHVQMIAADAAMTLDRLG